MEMLFLDSSGGFRGPRLGSLLGLEGFWSDDLLRTSRE